MLAVCEDCAGGSCEGDGVGGEDGGIVTSGVRSGLVSFEAKRPHVGFLALTN